MQSSLERKSCRLFLIMDYIMNEGNSAYRCHGIGATAWRAHLLLLLSVIVCPHGIPLAGDSGEGRCLLGIRVCRLRERIVPKVGGVG